MFADSPCEKEEEEVQCCPERRKNHPSSFETNMSSLQHVEERPSNLSRHPTRSCQAACLPQRQIGFNFWRNRLEFSPMGRLLWQVGFLGALPYSLLIAFHRCCISPRHAFIATDSHSLAPLLDNKKFLRRRGGAAVAERLHCSPPTKANWVQSPARVTSGFSRVGIMPVGVFSRGSPVSPVLAFRALFHSRLISPTSALKTPFLYPSYSLVGRRNAPDVIGQTPRAFSRLLLQICSTKSVRSSVLGQSINTRCIVSFSPYTSHSEDVTGRSR
ncbi:hypothetical protein PR048_030055 [Dryococelus australis]|uniref:Transmembrane protein n=1 Tax=Dryococelus australis TaxID=614101 RepID=A0ABQ9GAL1_9NEOP|nr:hypothetical protein PR048_030055 [Dryococelus australis]